MPYMWDENSILVFLHAYQKHPCLWNPYDVKYYNCLAKNEALKNIIKELNVSELNISDCLKQIRVIRAKYGEQQRRIIDALQSKKPYESPFAWFPIIAGMLAKVINDERKLQNGMKPLETISHGILKDHATISHDKSIHASNFPCAYAEIKKYTFKKLEETKQDFKAKPRRNTKFIKAGHGDPDKLDKKEKHDARLDLLSCPSCGWEDIKLDKSDITVNETNGLIQPNNVILCPEYTNVVDKLYEEFNPYRQRIANDRARYDNAVPCPNFSHNLPICTRYSANIPTNHMHYSQKANNCITNQPTRQEAVVTSKSKFCTREMQLSEQLFPVRGTKQTETNVECCNKKIQTRICQSGTTVALPISKYATFRTSNHAATNTVRRCHREIQDKAWIPQKRLKQAAVNTMEQCDKEIQSTICASRLKDHGFSEKPSAMIREPKQIADSMKLIPITSRTPRDVQDIIGIDLNTAECFTPNFVLITANGNYIPLMQIEAIKLKQLGIDKCSKEDLCQDQEETKKDTLALNGEKFVENEVCVKETCHYMKGYNPAIMRILLQCLEKMICSQEEAKTCSVTSRKIEMKSKFQGECVREEDSTKAFTILNEVKKCANKILDIYTAMDYSKNKFCPKYRSRDECLSKISVAPNSIGILKNGMDQFIEFYASLKNVEIFCKSIESETKNHGLLRNYIASMETAMEKQSSTENKETNMHAGNLCDVGLSVSRISFCDTETQYVPQQLRDTSVVTEHEQNFEEKISIGTQKREPISVREIKRNDGNSERILKCDKEICMHNARIAWTKGATDENKERHSALQHPSENTCRNYIIRKHYNKASIPVLAVSYAPEKEVNLINYHASLLSNKNYTRDENYRDALSYNRDWRRINNSTFELLSSRRISRIPLYARSQKFTQKTNMHRTSRSYM